MTPKLNGWNNNLTPSDGVGGRKPSHETLNTQPMTLTEETELPFTQQEIEAAKATRDEIIANDISVLKGIYMAGEIVMWDEMQAKLISERERAGKLMDGLSVIAEESKDMTTILYAKMLINQYNNKP